MNCCKHKYFVIFRGDDTDFPGNQELVIEIDTTRDLTGCSAHFSFQGFVQDFAEIPADRKLRLVIPNSETGKFALGAADARLWLTNGQKIRTVENKIHIVVTNRVEEAYDNDDPQAITVTISGGGGGSTVVLDDTVTAESQNGVKSSGIWSWVKSLLPQWLTRDYAEPATVASVSAKADKSALEAHVKNALNPHGVTAEQIFVYTKSEVNTKLAAKADKSTTLAGYGITDGATKASLAPEYSAISAYSVGAIVYHDGNIYQCKTEISDGGEAWNPAHWSKAQKLDDFFTDSNSLLNARITYERNATGLKDRAFNTLTFDGTEYNLSTALESVTPTASGQPRDLLIVATATAATTISFTAGTIKGDNPTIDGEGTWLITLTEYASGVWYCRQIKMEDAA